MIPERDDSLTPRRWWQFATVDVTPLRRHRDFQLLFIGRFVSFFGSMISFVALPYQVHQLTQNVFVVGVLGVVEFGPILVFAFIPDSLRGRLASIEMLSWSSGPALGNFEAGLVASIFNVRVSVVSGGVLCVVGCALCAAALPLFRSYDARRYALAPDPGMASVKQERQ